MPSDVTQPVVLGHKSRVAGSEAMPLGSTRPGTLSETNETEDSLCLSSLFLDHSLVHPSHGYLSPTHMDCVENGGVTEG